MSREPVPSGRMVSDSSRQAESRYATHLAVLRFLIAAFRPQQIIEFGMGHYSTPCLLSGGGHLISVESDPAWVRRMPTGNVRHQVVPWVGDKVEDYLEEHSEAVFDLAFIDGPTASRVPCVERLTGRCRLIVLHDSHTRCYRWDRLRLPRGITRFDYLIEPPETSVLVAHASDVAFLQQFSDLAC